MLSYSRSLCELEFKDKILTEMDVELFEYVWMKIRERFRKPTNNLKINFKDFSEFTKKHRNQNKRLKESVIRLGDITIVTNTKSDRPSEEYNFKFNAFYRETKKGKVPKGFTVDFDKDIYKLFDEPKSYSKYNEEYIYTLPTKYSKLLYKFLIGYKFKKDDFYVNSDALVKILNINPNQKDKKGNDVSYSYIQSQFIYGSICRINENTDLKVELKKYGNDYDENGNEIVKYKVSILKYKGNDKNNSKTNEEKRIDKWLGNLKKDIGDYDTESEQIPMVVIKAKFLDFPIYVDDKYRLIDSHNFIHTETPPKTLNKLNEWIKNNKIDYDVVMEDGYNKTYGKMCLLTDKELKQRGVI